MEKQIKTADYYWVQHQKHIILAEFYSCEMIKFDTSSIHYRRAYQNYCYHVRKIQENRKKAMAFSNEKR